MSATESAQRPIVLVALDGSPAAATALPLAQTVAAQLGAEPTILHVAEAHLLEQEAPQALDVAWPDQPGWSLRYQVGAPEQAIVRATADSDVALLVLTTHGRGGGGGERRLGRVAAAAIAHSACPLLLLRPETGARQQTPLQRLLLLIDSTLGTTADLRPAMELVGRLGAWVDVLYIASAAEVPAEPDRIDVPHYIDQPQHEWPHWAAEISDHLCRCGAPRRPDRPIRIFLAYDAVAAALERCIAEQQHDAIVVVRHPRGSLGQMPVLQAVLAQAPRPVLLVGGQPA
jgi:nucleotide-binding universal stress UspA family protein